MTSRDGSRTPRLGLLRSGVINHPPRPAIRDEIRLLRHGRDWRGQSIVPRSAETWVPEPGEHEFPTAWARAPLAVAVRTVLLRGILKPTVWSQTAPAVEGTDYLEQLPGPCIFVANHSSHLDTPLILGSLPSRFAHRIAVAAAADYFFATPWRGVTTALFFNAFPVDRHGSGRLRSRAGELLGDGWSLLLYPEKTRSQDGWMKSFGLGAAHLCVAKALPLVPIAIRGSYNAMPPGASWPQRGRPRITVRYGRPLVPAEGEKAVEFGHRMTRAVARLAAEEDLGWYGSLRAAANGAIDLPSSGDLGTRQAEPGAIPGTGEAHHGSSDIARWRRIWASTQPARGATNRRVWR
jgi:1-acyl-sn-glycerol-3-phosphate acyltransferase